jgi:hypothetical protein
VAWSLTLREEHRLRVFENGVLRGISGPSRAEVTGSSRKPHNLYFSPSTIKIIKHQPQQAVQKARKSAQVPSSSSSDVITIATEEQHISTELSEACQRKGKIMIITNIATYLIK